MADVFQSPRTTHVRQPSKIPAMLGKSLNEVSDSDGNVRAQNTMMPPPLPAGGGAVKHKPSNCTESPFQPFSLNKRDMILHFFGRLHITPALRMLTPTPNATVPEPAAKRKTLAERAGEVGRSNLAAPPSSRPVNSSVRAMAAAGIRGQSLHSSSASSRAASIASNSSAGCGSLSSRHTSGSSLFNGSVGSGTRPPSAHSINYANSSLQHGRATYHGPRSAMRPTTVLEHLAGVDDSISRKQMGTPNISTTRADSPVLSLRKQRRRKDADSEDIPSSDKGQLQRINVSYNPLRAVSITTGMQSLNLKGEPAAIGHDCCPCTPSYIPKPVPQSSTCTLQPFSPPLQSLKRHFNTTSPSKSPSKAQFLNRFTNTHAAWDSSSRIEEMEQDMQHFYGINERMKQSQSGLNILQEQVNLQNTRIKELESIRADLSAANARLEARVETLHTSNITLQESKTSLQSSLDDARRHSRDAQDSLDELRRSVRIESDDLDRKHRKEKEQLEDELQRRTRKSQREAEDESANLQKVHKDEMAELEKRLRAEIEEERTRRIREVDEKSQILAKMRDGAEKEGVTRDREIQNLRSDLSRLQAEVELERSSKQGLLARFNDASTTNASLDSAMQAMRGKIEFLESDSQAQSQEFAYLKRREQEAIAAAEEANNKLRAEETLRRKLHNQVQELKGNIRVFCRVRPTMQTEAVEAAGISFPDDSEESKDIVVLGPEQKSSLGTVTTSKNGFSFDRVFGPAAQNVDIFDEISQLVQSALDGYNVCIFCYGQTGSGKTYTMSSSDGMIPLAVHQIYQTASELKQKGWDYTMEGSFVEVYNEKLNDLLGRSEDLDKKKLEIRHDHAKGKTTITDVTSVTLDSPDMLQSLLDRASKNRSVAATKANERSSRSHSVFMLRLNGSNSVTGERSEGTLNLVDLAGSERIAHSGATGDRLKETQNINRSLSCLGDVIAALGQQGPSKEDKHIPYRNSKLTHLLELSLGGNSKTLMFVMVSPLQAHLQETLTSLRFATKVHNTHIGTARKQIKVRN